jgi:hypothetical protein
MPTPSHQTQSRKLAALALGLILSGCPNENPCPPCYIDYTPTTKSTVYLQVDQRYVELGVVGARIVLEDDRGKSEKHELDLSLVVLNADMHQYVMSELDLVGDEGGGEGRRPIAAWIDMDFKKDGKVVTFRSPLSFGRPS